MKKFLILPVLFILTSCISVLHFDSNEYLLLTKMKTDIVDTKPFCGGKINIDHVLKDSKIIQTYTQYPESNKELNNSTTVILKMVTELKTRYDTDVPSKAYCETKIDNIVEAIDIVRKHLADRRTSDGLIK